jgi:hypothetical protein
MLSTAAHEAAASPALPARLRLRADHSGPTVLDGGWWPRSADPATELPGLVLALDERHGRVTRLMLGAADWKASRPRRLVFAGPAGGRVVHLGWFATMPAGLLTAISASGQRTDLLTVPPRTSEPDALAAMKQAAWTGNRDHTPALLAVITPSAGAPEKLGSAGGQLGTRDGEGGQLPDQETGPDRPRPAPTAGSGERHPGPAGPEGS